MATIWADQPFQLMVVPGTEGLPNSSNPDVAEIVADMANVHNMLLRGLNAIYLQCENVKEPKDTTDFIKYVKFWGDGIHHHHHSEETLIFPYFDEIAKKGGATESIMETNVEQHHLFEPGLHALIGFAEEVLEGKKAYDGKEVKRIVDEFAPVLTQHLHDEIKTLMRLEPYDGKAIAQVTDSATKKIVAQADTYTVLPMLFGCLDKTHAGTGNFPKVPFFLPWLNAYIFRRKHKGSWRFHPCDAWSRPQPLPFGPKSA
ncbi:hypothetical protein P154DRAFT_15528 [Amniculicola lignicola CBS 123094]|uniref:Hemerythrin-like domain-containing protein n=1 Tax=Amniculicola lignicola CBS 123094 TaxID=1392246 RepID=A0A6A5X558_9PLEO|nr:hypothetical protein P154DRAFT_15528 [Amniculicola lignicola CBS 123094]